MTWDLRSSRLSGVLVDVFLFNLVCYYSKDGIYYALFHSIINYMEKLPGVVSYTNHLNWLQCVQNRLLRLVYRNTFAQGKPMNL